MAKAFIFDMDGVIVDNHHFHVTAWKRFCDETGIEFNEQEFRKKYFGKNNHDILTGLMQKQIPTREVNILGERKEAIYREVYSEHMQMVEGLEDLLINLLKKEKLLAVATSAPVSNLNFVLDGLQIRKYFHSLCNEEDVKRAKPDPEIYLKTAEKLRVKPNECIVFEDSVSGIMAAKNAGMKVVALITTHTQEELPEPELFIKNFSDTKLANYLNNNKLKNEY
jgi:beta-phosphoglucomutase family hydrolase